jgi:hypothetical protein
MATKGPAVPAQQQRHMFAAERVLFFVVAYLMMLLVWRVYAADDCSINGTGAVGRLIIGTRGRSATRPSDIRST